MITYAITVRNFFSTDTTHTAWLYYNIMTFGFIRGTYYYIVYYYGRNCAVKDKYKYTPPHISDVFTHNLAMEIHIIILDVNFLSTLLCVSLHSGRSGSKLAEGCLSYFIQFSYMKLIIKGIHYLRRKKWRDVIPPYHPPLRPLSLHQLQNIGTLTFKHLNYTVVCINNNVCFRKHSLFHCTHLPTLE